MILLCFSRGGKGYDSCDTKLGVGGGRTRLVGDFSALPLPIENGDPMGVAIVSTGRSGKKPLPAGESTYWDTLRLLVSALRGRDRSQLARVVLSEEEIQKIHTWRPQERL